VQPNDSILINVNIDNRTMRLRVAVKDEEDVRLSAQVLNQRIGAFKSFQAQEPTDRLSWAALDLAGEVVRHSKSHRSQDELLDQELTAIEGLLYT
jgi:hypothetical protein